jgi:CheY-like chemotaxis protein
LTTKIPDDTGGIKLISREAGAPALDLAALTLPLSLLDILSEELIRGQQVLPVRLEADRLFVASTRPEDRVLHDEIAFLTGRKVVAYAAHPEQLADTIRAVFEARKRGALVWRGPKAARSRPPGEGSLDGALRRETLGSTPPVREPFVNDSSYPTPPPPPLHRARPCVLVVDDEPVIRRIVIDSLAQRGHEVLEAGCGVEAFQLIKQREPDAILLDAMLPDVHGFEICKRLKTSRRYNHIPIIMITAVYKGWRMAADLKDSYGVAATVEKPFDLHHLVRVLEQALAGRAPGERPTPQALSGEAQRLYQSAADAYRREDLDAATDALTAAIQIDPLSATLHHQLGLVQARRGRDFAAIQELETAVDLDPHRFQTLRNLAVLYQKHGFRRKASELWERCIAQAPDDPTRAEIRKVLLSMF